MTTAVNTVWLLLQATVLVVWIAAIWMAVETLQGLVL
jgi:hypothetical protein